MTNTDEILASLTQKIQNFATTSVEEEPQIDLSGTILTIENITSILYNLGFYQAVQVDDVPEKVIIYHKHEGNTFDIEVEADTPSLLLLRKSF